MSGRLFGNSNGDETYGHVGKIRLWFEFRSVAYVLAARQVTDGDLDGAAAVPSHTVIADPDEIAYYNCFGPADRTRPVGLGGRQSLGDRGVLSHHQERDRSRPLSGPRVPGLVPAHHLVDGRSRPSDEPASWTDAEALRASEGPARQIYSGHQSLHTLALHEIEYYYPFRLICIMIIIN